MSKSKKTYNLQAMHPKQRGILVMQHIKKYAAGEIDIGMILQALELGIVRPVANNFSKKEVPLITEAARNGHIDLFEPLVDAGYSINDTDINGFSAMTYCAENGDLLGLTELRYLGAALVPEAALAYGKDSPLEIACRRWHPHCVTFLMSAGAPLVLEKSRPSGEKMTIHALERALHNVPQTPDEIERLNSVVEILLTAGQPFNPNVYSRGMDALSLLKKRDHDLPAYAAHQKLCAAIKSGFAADADMTVAEGITIKKTTLVLKL